MVPLEKFGRSAGKCRIDAVLGQELDEVTTKEIGGELGKHGRRLTLARRGNGHVQRRPSRVPFEVEGPAAGAGGEVEHRLTQHGHRGR